ncbi:hypothetical protein MPSEU_000374900 [Mayamaea pseudoterrestris]|nr:hypothetical protein MPSEU_000374900 [Mayamaea pseudoterrestris]
MQIVVFVLDSSPSMNTPYPIGGNKTRLDVAKEALQNMLCDLIIDSNHNKANVVVCKTSVTHHHMYSDKDSTFGDENNGAEDDEEGIPFPNVTSLSNIIDKPSLEFLKQVAQVESTMTLEEVDMTRGDVIDGIMVAADALHQQTKTNKTAQRKIIVLTDADHDFIIDEWQRNHLIVSLISLNCPLEVLGLDFQSSADFCNRPESILSDIKVKLETEIGEAGNETVYSDKQEKEDALVCLAGQTGGRVIAVSTLHDVLEANKGWKKTNTILYKNHFILAPGFDIDAKHMLLSRKFDLPRMTQKIVLEDAHEMPRVDEFGRPVLDSVLRTYNFTYQADVGKPLPELFDVEDTVRAYPYNTANVMTNDDDEARILSVLGFNGKPVRIELLGYVERFRVPDHYMIGPPTLITGGLSRKSCSAIAAMAECLAREEMVALVTFYKKKDKAGYFGGLFPFPEPDHPSTTHLVFMQLPYGGDVQDLNVDLFPLDAFVDESKRAEASAADDLIDSLMLPDNFLTPGCVPNPLTRSWFQTLIKRIVEPSCEPVLWRREQEIDPISTPPYVLRGAASALTDFYQAFPLKDMVKLVKEVKEKNKREKGKRKVHTFEDHLDD